MIYLVWKANQILQLDFQFSPSEISMIKGKQRLDGSMWYQERLATLTLAYLQLNNHQDPQCHF